VATQLKKYLQNYHKQYFTKNLILLPPSFLHNGYWVSFSGYSRLGVA